MEFTCKWCGEIKPEEMFVKRDVNEPYSERNIRCCRSCNQARNRQRYRNPEIRKKQLAANEKWRKENPEKMGVYVKDFISKNPINVKARNKVRHMLRRGYWAKQPCEVCGASDYVEAHHDSYAEAHWTTVRWLCKAHHEAWHSALDPVKRPVLEEPLAEVANLREKHDELQHQIAALRREAVELKKRADDIEFSAWSEVQRIAVDLFRKTFRK